MRIFIDIGHPAHVHYIRNIIYILSSRGHVFFVTARDKECTHALLEHYNIDYVSRKRGSNSIFGKLFYLISADFFLWRKARAFKPDVFLSFSSPYAAHTAALTGRPHIVHDDTEQNKLIHLMYRPFTKTVIIPHCYESQIGKKQIRIPAYFELFHLHPNYFKPDPGIYNELGLEHGDPYVIFRFVSRGASHDYGSKGMNLELKRQAVNKLSQICKVFISSETELPPELEQHKLNIPPWRVHHALSFAQLLFGESATMTSEAAVLGTPAIYINKHGRGYTREEEEKYQLVHNFNESLSQQKEAIDKAVEIIENKEHKKKLKEKHKKLLKDTIDPTKFSVWFIENYPDSFRIMKEDKKYCERFN